MPDQLARSLAAGLLATDVDTATRHAGPCSLCQHAILAGDRHASLVPTGRLAHLHCIGRLATARRSGVPVIR